MMAEPTHEDVEARLREKQTGQRVITVDGQPVATVDVVTAVGVFSARVDTPGGDVWVAPGASSPSGALVTLKAAIRRSIRDCERALHAVEAYERGESDF